MRYKESEIDRKNFNWFGNDNTCATLNDIKLMRGSIRGLYPFMVTFSYPTSAFAGENGSGKSTLLAISACAFHNTKKGYKQIDKNKTYYTFSDFFVQTKDEVLPDGIVIRYQIRHNDWHGSEPGLGWQKSSKKHGGKWTNYDRRVDRNVIYYGVERVVPPYERSAHRAYQNYFIPIDMPKPQRERICDIAGKIFNKNYDDFAVYQHSKYRLPMVHNGSLVYSGFNMGAGESAVFNILVSLFEAGPGTLLVVDEIELGLHEKAQKKLIEELKNICNELHCQIICSTHSPIILESLPPHARFFIESRSKKSVVTQGISARYACGKLAGKNSDELTIFVEDEVGESIFRNILPIEIRGRTQILPIGSSEAVLRQVAARYREGQKNFVAFLDGDKQNGHRNAAEKVKRYLEDRFDCNEDQMNQWIDTHLRYLPGNTWPEKWLMQQAIECGNMLELTRLWGVDKSAILDILDNAMRAGKHKEFFSLEKGLHLPREQVRSDVIRFIGANSLSEFEKTIKAINSLLHQGQ